LPWIDDMEGAETVGVSHRETDDAPVFALAALAINQ
jgi:hypothetical protein